MIRSLASMRPATAPKPQNDPGFTRPGGDTGPEVAYAPDDLVKLDLVRQHQAVTVEKPDGSKIEEKRAVERSDYGLHLGDGLFYDLNGNLSFVPYLAFFAPIETAVAGADGRFTVDPPGLGNSVAVDPSGSIDPFGPFNSTSVSFRANKAIIDQNGFENDTEVRLSGNTLVIDPRGAHNDITIERRSNGLVVTSAGGRRVALESKENGWDLNPPGRGWNTSIRKHGHQITVDEPGLGNSTSITVSPERIDVNPSGLGNSKEFERNGDSISFGSTNWFARKTSVTAG